MRNKLRSIGIVWLFSVLTGCFNSSAPEEVVLVDKNEEVPMVVSEQIHELVRFLANRNGYLKDSILLSEYALLQQFYENNGYHPVWSEGDRWKPAGDSLFFAISQAKSYGLFPSDYHHRLLLEIRNKIILDSVSRKNAALWARADLLLTDACWKMAHHLKYGHLNRDSITIRKDSAFTEEEKLTLLGSLYRNGQVQTILGRLEPRHKKYHELKQGLAGFLAKAKFQPVEQITYPTADSMAFVQQVARKLKGMGLLDSSWVAGDDSLVYARAVKKYQASKGIVTTGFVAQLTVASLNTTDWDYFNTIALNLDRYRQLPDTMPETYVWVNLPAYQLEVMDYDTIALKSKIIIGTPKTPTPVLNSSITNFITYPQWTVPYSIIFKEMLPKIRKDIGYLAKENLMVVDRNDSVIAPETIDWSKVSRNTFPYLLRQRQGDDNSLGVMKFNFRNKYSVYLHDTNARGLFSRETRALSHGCVRVQKWEDLSHFLVRNNEIRYHPDTIRALILRQEKKTIGDFPHVPIYIRYITAAGVEGDIQFFPDIYEEDKRLKERYFASKPINP
jgi:murein L,D-transpeptidase YcbB/YkuD